MVPRYARPAMTAIWEPESKYAIWFLIEAHATSIIGNNAISIGIFLFSTSSTT